MEIKVTCDCGTKYKFEVEPIDGHMPQPVKCPSCGANGTAQANGAIREALSGGAAAGSPAVESAPASPAPAPAASRLRISAQHAAPVTPTIAPAYQPAHLQSGHGVEGGSAVWKDRGKKALALLGKGVALLLILLAMLMGFGGKKGKRLRSLVKLTSLILRSDEDSEAEDLHWNLWGQDIVLLLIRHTNETEVAQACTTFWQESYKKKVAFVATNDISFDENQIGIIPAHNGCVQIVGGLKWPKEDFEKLTQQLSQKFNTVAVETRDVDFSGAYVFGVFENGEKKFRAEMQIKGTTLQDMEEEVTVEGKQWALDHGFKPDQDGWDGFYLSDGDIITQKLGFKLWDKEGWDRCLVMTEITTQRPTRVMPASAAKSR